MLQKVIAREKGRGGAELNIFCACRYAALTACRRLWRVGFPFRLSLKKCENLSYSPIK
jgi:hypothetical protein